MASLSLFLLHFLNFAACGILLVLHSLEDFCRVVVAYVLSLGLLLLLLLFLILVLLLLVLILVFVLVLILVLVLLLLLLLVLILVFVLILVLVLILLLLLLLLEFQLGQTKVFAGLVVIRIAAQCAFVSANSLFVLLLVEGHVAEVI